MKSNPTTRRECCRLCSIDRSYKGKDPDCNNGECTCHLVPVAEKSFHIDKYVCHGEDCTHPSHKQPSAESVPKCYKGEPYCILGVMTHDHPKEPSAEKAKRNLEIFKLLHEYAMKTTNTHDLDLIEEAQRIVLADLPPKEPSAEEKEWAGREAYHKGMFGAEVSQVGWEENSAKSILFDFWRDYSNAETSEDRDEVIERHSAHLVKVSSVLLEQERERWAVKVEAAKIRDHDECGHAWGPNGDDGYNRALEHVVILLRSQNQ